MTERLSPERRAEIEVELALHAGCPSECTHRTLLTELHAVEAENRMLREGLDKVIEHIDSHGTSVFRSGCRRFARAHAVPGLLERRTGGTPMIEPRPLTAEERATFAGMAESMAGRFEAIPTLYAALLHTEAERDALRRAVEKALGMMVSDGECYNDWCSRQGHDKDCPALVLTEALEAKT